MNTRRADRPRFLLPVCALVLLFVTSADAQSLKGRVVLHAQPEDVEVIEVADVPGHALTVVKGTGLVFLENGEIAEVTETELLDFVNWVGPYRTYRVITFDDGSTITSTASGTNTRMVEGRYAEFEGEEEITGGTGRFAGIAGRGRHSGRVRVTGAGAYYDFEAAYSVGAR